MNQTSSSLSIIFAGTPDFAAKHLIKLLESNYNVIAVYTQPDRPAGRGNKLTESPVKQIALEYNIPIFQPVNFKQQPAIDELAHLNADLMIVVAYGLILPKSVLNATHLGCINVHGSLLPKWRGAAPIQRACWAGDNETGVTIMQMDEGLDSGDMLYKLSCPITKFDTSASLYDKLAELGPDALLNTLEQLQKGSLSPEKQDESLVTYAHKLSKNEAKLDWSMSAIQLTRCVKAFNPWPVSYFEIDNNIIKVWQAQAIENVGKSPIGSILNIDKNGIQIQTQNGIFNITEIQPAGKKRMSVQDYLNGKQSLLEPGAILK